MGYSEYHRKREDKKKLGKKYKQMFGGKEPWEQEGFGSKEEWIDANIQSF